MNMNKKGFELAINTMVILILAVVLLVFLIFLITNSSTDFRDRIRSFTSYSNVDEVVQGCNIFVDVDSSYAYCCEKKNVKYFEDGEKMKEDFTCGEISEKEFGDEIKVNDWDCKEVSC